MISTLDNQISILVRGMEEIQRATSILKEEGIEGSSDVKTLIGAGIYARSSLKLKEKLLVPIGSDIYIEEDRENTIKRLQKNFEEVGGSLKTAQERRDDLAMRYDSLVTMIQQSPQKSK
jgi:prefoldin alpha subunit